MKSCFPQRDKRLSKTRVCNANAKFRDHILGKEALHKHVQIYGDIWKALGQNTIYKHGIGIESPFFWNNAYHVLEKISS